MTKYDRVRFDMFVRVVQFILDNIADFPPGSVVGAQLVILQAVVDRLQELMGDQTEGFADARFEFFNKDTAREGLRGEMSEISRTARSMVYEFPGIDLKFRMTRNNNDAELLGKGRAFLAEAEPLKDDFIRYEMNKNFLNDLQMWIDNFENSLDAPGTATDAHVAATAEFGAQTRKGMETVRTMSGAVKNKYRSSVGKLAAWLSASHVEKIKAENPGERDEGRGMRDEGRGVSVKR